MNLQQFLQQFVLTKNSTQKSNITSIKGGKWYIPENKLKEFYDIVSSQKIDIPLVEKINDIHPLVFDLDLKYQDVLTERSYTEDAIESLIEHLWQEMKEFIDLSDFKSKGTILVLEKEKPYPCNKGVFKSKDGIHLIFPDIILDKKAYKKIVTSVVEKDQIKNIFDEGSEISPDNSTNGILDSSFSSWQLYGCGKTGESPYLVTRVYKMGEDGYPDENEVDDYYSNPRNILNLSSMCFRDSINIKYTSKFDNTFKKNSSSKSSSNKEITTDKGIMSDMSKFAGMFMQESIQNSNRNPYFQFEEEDAKFIKALVKCLSKERASTYGLDDKGGWMDVALCLHNINQEPQFKDISFLEDWKLFSSKCSLYDPVECENKWESINDSYTGERLGMGSLMFWAKNDNETMFKKAKADSLSSLIDESVKIGAGADHLIANIVYKYYEDEFISVNVKDDWYYFNGVRWERTLEGTMLRMKIHKEISMLYAGYYTKYAQKTVDNPDDENFKKHLKNIQEIQIKLLKDSYVSTLMNSLRNLFYKKEIMEKFDTDTNLLGFENGIYDLKNNIFREGRPEDYVTMSTKVTMPVDSSNLPIKLDDMIASFSLIPRYDEVYEMLDDFLNKIVPLPSVKKYALKFLAKCLSGENRDEGFYIWTGTGGNGKSKLIDLTSMCMGDYSCNLPIALLTQKRKASGAASPEMALTMGKRLCVMQEPDVNETMNIGQMKELTGNDKIQARALFKEPFFFTPQFKLVCMCNDLPHIPSNDDGTWRRLEVVDFVSKFVDSESDVNHELNRYIKDKTIKNKIPMWVIPFFAMLLPMWRDYDENSIEIPDEIKAKTNEYRGDNDIIGQWIGQYCETADNVVSANGVTKLAPTEFKPLYDNFTEFCGDVLGRQSNNIPDMSVVKTGLKKWQEKSEWGLCYGKRKDQSGPNGYEACMRFNLVVSK
jgi:P4 family phage/plasmid primase-like protien